ncbi:heterokaryon incompatibility protein-domain-containing protein [Nemania abortiva]|nr:heterokaryon incompatibility protein-domain-containing protein [Nemania abortiva]
MHRPRTVSQGSHDVHCQLLRLNLDATRQRGLTKHPFIALSYTWGSPEVKEEILINGRKLSVTINLYEALIHLRSLLSPVPLWIDAVCINQDDVEERQREVAKMGRIYRDATAAILWLGLSEGDYDTPDACMMKFSEAALIISKVEMLHREIHDIYGGTDENPWELMKGVYEGGDLGMNPIHIALWALFTLPAWRRVWIMQELVLAQDTYILWGQELINFQVLDSLLEVQDQFRPVNPYFDDTQAALRRYTMARQVIMFRGHRVSLLEALLAVRYREATLEHDYVYGLLGFVDVADSVILPAYNKPFRDIYMEAFRIIFRQEPNLDVLSACDRGWASCSCLEGETDSNWPTWLPDWSWKPIKSLSRGEKFGGSFQFDIQSLLLDTRHYTAIEFRACGDSEKCAQIPPNEEQLSVRGIEFDIVEEIIHYQDGVIEPELWVDAVKSRWDQGLLRNVYDTIGTLKYACMRTARYGHSENIVALHCEMKAFDGVQTEGRPEGTTTEEDIPSVAFEPFDPGEKSSKTAGEDQLQKDFSLMVVGSSKSSYCVTRRGYVGRSPALARVGDKICVLFGGKVPMLLRQQEGSEFCKLVGEIYIHGIMQGAAMEAMKDQWKDFVIV